MSGKGSITVDVSKLPEVIFLVRHEFAEALRRRLELETDPRVRACLREIAAEFEVGGRL